MTEARAPLSLKEDVTPRSSNSTEAVTTAIDISTLLHLDSFNDDVLFAIFKRLDIQNRLTCAKVSHRWNKLLKKWVDIRSIAISEKHFSIKNEFIEASIPFKVQDSTRINAMVLMFLKKCSHAFNLVIHNAQVLKYFATIWSKFENLELLVLPNDTFDELKFKDSTTLLHLLSNSKLQSLHILEHVKAFPSKKRIFAPLHVSVMSSKRLQVFHAHGIILGPFAIEKLAEKYYDTLQELRISAVCVHTPDAARYWNAISKFKGLKVLELPPSLFSISQNLALTNIAVLPTLQKLESISVFICPNAGIEVGLFLSSVPKSLRKLIVRTYADELPVSVMAALNQQKICVCFLHVPKSLRKLIVRTYADELPVSVMAVLNQQKICVYSVVTATEGLTIASSPLCTTQESTAITQGSVTPPSTPLTSVSLASTQEATSSISVASTQASEIQPARENSSVAENRGNPLNPAATAQPIIAPSTNAAPAQELPAPTPPVVVPSTLPAAPIQDANSNNALPTAAAAQNIPAFIEEHDLSSPHSSPSTSNTSLASTSSGQSTTSSTSGTTSVSTATTSTTSNSSVGTGWFN
uniref:F-box domain-containing protein n=1 Tax=Panagrolaimus sp. ES5 TaxID=591445 RepID=A0AC34FIR7_9BILA